MTVIQDLQMYIKGTPGVGPERLYFVYSVRDGDFTGGDNFVVEDPDFTKSLATLWKEGIAAIKAREG